jgi:hypothetical protein
MSDETWKVLGRPEPTALEDARLQLHYAAQLVAAVGATFLEPRPDDSHPNLGWLESTGALAGHVVPGERPFQAALRLADLELLLLDGDAKPIDSLALGGRTLEQAQAWLSGAIGRYRGPHARGSELTRPPYDLPPHPVAQGAAFARRPDRAFAELARWYANADAVLEELVARTRSASEVRCWPHHFDIATLITLTRGADGKATSTIGVGLSPGDASYAEPYWYVSPWPTAEHPKLPKLPGGGEWHTEDFLAAVLTGSRHVEAQSAQEQRSRLVAFLDAAVAACRRVIEA